MVADPARVYVVSGGSSGRDNTNASSNSTSLPDLLRRQGSSNKRSKRPSSKSKASLARDAELAKIELIQDFEFPEASNRVTTSNDGQFVVATGTYKPQIRVWECDQLSLKFERHTEAENVDFLLLSDDWTKSLHLQSDRSVELHSQGGTYARVRIPKFGRALGYHFPSADAIVGAVGNEVYRLNLDQGRFLAPFVLEGFGSSAAAGVGGEVLGVNSVDVNPAHGLLAFGTDGAGIVELWDPRWRRKVGALSVATRTVLDSAWHSTRSALPGIFDSKKEANAAASGLSVTALSSAQDGLNMAVGTSTGHVLLYDLRMARAYSTKDQGFSLPIKSLCWPGDRSSKSYYGGARQVAGTRAEAEGTVLSADAKVVKVWKKETPGENVVTITPPSSAADLNDIHQVPGTGLLLAAVEGTQMAAWYVPTLGPAPRWCNFIDTLTDEMDGDVSGAGARGVYEDFKFVDKAELKRLGMDNLIGTDLLRPYMHGYFVALGLYEKARLVANPTAYADARERAIKTKLEKEAESRIRGAGKTAAASKLSANVKVNKDLAAKLEKQRARAEARRAKAATDPAGEASVEVSQSGKAASANLLDDARFKALFTNPEFQVDTTSREYALLNPSTVAREAFNLDRAGDAEKVPRKRTAVEEEELEAENDTDSSMSNRDSEEDDDQDDDSEADSSDAGDLRDVEMPSKRRIPAQSSAPATLLRDNVKRGGVRLHNGDDGDVADAFNPGGSRRQSFQERMKARNNSRHSSSQSSIWRQKDKDQGEDGGGEITWMPMDGGSKGTRCGNDARQDTRSNGRGTKQKQGETFGAGLSKGAGSEEGMGVDTLSEDARFGRTHRRHTSRSASKNALRR
ncbi:hypothetical protein K437DRAFT_257371 [Tilletiaria anomala UBC 951]|uniref:Uncharacterized protein n=1 Tax=Tilletiaria anomala (strain ATCC 24038 / CBS 436.72 / UBC 951) TaxID=1037660 RepID=A0A066VYA4_TILAU|nr:uncharacterized protein K437DRAFT_257371 [Tilletiaria anomala UBC 951]KDN43789.1 hypothetical protein K437DRAFT_257371 [Tilletiaria anomala UBC 951]